MTFPRLQAALAFAGIVVASCNALAGDWLKAFMAGTVAVFFGLEATGTPVLFRLRQALERRRRDPGPPETPWRRLTAGLGPLERVLLVWAIVVLAVGSLGFWAVVGLR